MKVMGQAGQSIQQLLRDQGVPEARLAQAVQEVAQLNQLDPAAPLSEARELTLPDRFEMATSQGVVEQPTAFQHLRAQSQGAGRKIGSLGPHAFDGFAPSTAQSAAQTQQQPGDIKYIVPPGTGGGDQPLYIMPPPGHGGGDDQPLYILPPGHRPPTGGDDQPLYILPPGDGPAPGGDSRPIYILPPGGLPRRGTDRPIGIVPPGIGSPVDSDDDE